jgi:hypothetical protein
MSGYVLGEKAKMYKSVKDNWWPYCPLCGKPWKCSNPSVLERAFNWREMSTSYDNCFQCPFLSTSKAPARKCTQDYDDWCSCKSYDLIGKMTEMYEELEELRWEHLIKQYLKRRTGLNVE